MDLMIYFGQKNIKRANNSIIRNNIIVYVPILRVKIGQKLIMSIPDYQTLILPLLKAVNHSGRLSMRDVTQLLSREFNLTDADCRELLPSGKQTIIQNRVGWARTYL